MEKTSNGINLYGPPKIYYLIETEGESRNVTALIVILLDLLIMFIFVISIMNLRGYEVLFERDR